MHIRILFGLTGIDVAANVGGAAGDMEWNVLRDEDGADLATRLDPFFAAWGEGDVETIKSFMAHDIEYRSPWAAQPVTRGPDDVASEMIAERQIFSSLATQEVLLGVRCATYMVFADDTRVALTFACRDDHKVEVILVCAEAEIPYERQIVRR